MEGLRRRLPQAEEFKGGTGLLKRRARQVNLSTSQAETLTPSGRVFTYHRLCLVLIVAIK